MDPIEFDILAIFLAALVGTAVSVALSEATHRLRRFGVAGDTPPDRPTAAAYATICLCLFFTAAALSVIAGPEGGSDTLVRTAVLLWAVLILPVLVASAMLERGTCGGAVIPVAHWFCVLVAQALTLSAAFA